MSFFDYNRNMLEIRRQHYLDSLSRFAQTPNIVAVVGLRRVGKSVLLRQFADGVRRSEQVSYVDKESFDFAEVKTAADLVGYVNATTRKGEPRLVVVDEVQQIEQWQTAIASLNAEPSTRVAISGSNASLFSGELATRIAGRYLTLQV
ncbi:AAA family ATPase, partial [Candidatus Fermentibacteria bacterium]|nr:AAA family ATPase [Candidatus Fermentibacteria bacterium]